MKTHTPTPEMAADREAWCRQNLKAWSKDGSDPAWGNARCPLHDDSSASLRVNLESGGFVCHAASCARTGILPQLAEEAGLAPAPRIPEREKKERSSNRGRPAEAPLAEYVYQDASGTNVLCEAGYAPWKLHRRNRWMVDNSQKVVALYDGSPKGGTAACVRYARSKNVEVINLWEAWTNERR